MAKAHGMRTPTADLAWGSSGGDAARSLMAGMRRSQRQAFREEVPSAFRKLAETSGSDLGRTNPNVASVFPGKAQQEQLHALLRPTSHSPPHQGGSSSRGSAAQNPVLSASYAKPGTHCEARSSAAQRTAVSMHRKYGGPSTSTVGADSFDPVGVPTPHSRVATAGIMPASRRMHLRAKNNKAAVTVSLGPHDIAGTSQQHGTDPSSQNNPLIESYDMHNTFDLKHQLRARGYADGGFEKEHHH